MGDDRDLEHETRKAGQPATGSNEPPRGSCRRRKGPRRCWVESSMVAARYPAQRRVYRQEASPLEVRLMLLHTLTARRAVGRAACRTCPIAVARRSPKESRPSCNANAPSTLADCSAPSKCIAPWTSMQGAFLLRRRFEEFCAIASQLATAPALVRPTQLAKDDGRCLLWHLVQRTTAVAWPDKSSGGFFNATSTTP